MTLNIIDKISDNKKITHRLEHNIRVGDILNIKLEMGKDKKRKQNIKGICLAYKKSNTINASLLIRSYVSGEYIEYIIPLHNPNIIEIKYIGHIHVKQSKLYYLRNKNISSQIL